MIHFKDFSIRSKLNCLAAFAAALALFLACVTFVANDYFTIRQEMIRNASTTAELVCASSIAVLRANDTDNAADMLLPLRLEPIVRRAFLFDSRGQVVAHYHRDDLRALSATPSLEFVGHRFNRDGQLEMIRVISDAAGPVGTLYVEAGSDQLADCITRDLMFSAIVLLVSLGTTMVFSHRLCQIIAVPITSLAATAQRISDERDYSIRVTKLARDDIGLLYDAFNHMLERIETSERELHAAHDELACNIEKIMDKNKRLNDEITDRRKAEHELRELQQRFVESAHRAGKAEIATSVLHNVGNVLNSVNVSAGVISATVRSFGIQDLVCAAELITEHQDDLGRYFTNDDRGKHLPEFLTELSQHLTCQQRDVLDEVESLTHNVEHIKDIVALQQSHAGVSGLIQRTSFSEVIDDAVRINGASLGRHGITVERELEDFTLVELDRQKLLQIMINLISNAKYAVMEHQEVDEKRITIRLRRVNDCACIEVEDNGVGIERDNLTRMFSHGFTTRKEGHGFGLHSAALAAKEMGGTLSARSDGPGAGAKFTLRLPVEMDASVPQLQ